jgi:DNA-binding transcriptional ArsR family regulator
MSERRGERPTGVERRLERAIVLQLLGEEGERRSSQAQLAAALDVEARALSRALARLSDAGVVCVAGKQVWASTAARRIDELGLIAI